MSTGDICFTLQSLRLLQPGALFLYTGWGRFFLSFIKPYFPTGTVFWIFLHCKSLVYTFSYFICEVLKDVDSLLRPWWSIYLLCMREFWLVVSLKLSLPCRPFLLEICFPWFPSSSTKIPYFSRVEKPVPMSILVILSHRLIFVHLILRRSILFDFKRSGFLRKLFLSIILLVVQNRIPILYLWLLEFSSFLCSKISLSWSFLFISCCLT